MVSSCILQKLLLIGAVVLWLVAANDASDSDNPLKDDSRHRPTMYTYFERVEPDWTGMSHKDHADLLQFWNDSWYQAGWNPVVLSQQDALRMETALYGERHARSLHDTLAELAPYTRMLLHRWMAMSERGGWYCDYDVFPLFSLKHHPQAHDFFDLPSSVLTLHEMVAPTLVSGSAAAWQNMTRRLIKHAWLDRQGKERSFWTDDLALLDIRYEARGVEDDDSVMRVARNVVQADRVLGLLHFDQAESDSTPTCPAVKKNRWVVHYSPLALQRAVDLPSNLRLPRHRLTLAREWLPKWMSLCATSLFSRNETAS